MGTETKPTTKEISEAILEVLQRHKTPRTFWDLLLSFSRHAFGRNEYVNERRQKEHLALVGGGRSEHETYTVRYDPEEVEEILKAVDLLIQEGKCRIAALPHLTVGSFDGTHTYEYGFTIVLADNPVTFVPWKEGG